ncbi:lysine N(6)-hydroxylase/L-ornithine N(5)-oxygenase family protein [Lentzea sp. NPDC060358]|uniref:lysine N(6)-hydroxylase/L-ornithine N(5)-oxygenase family protein n=1 Tax=Lentzea sp. NPDC060358 TaxID=3347103 RepID=UPI00364867EF
MERCDVLGVGIGPFNLALAALAEPLHALGLVCVDRKPEFTWHPGLLIDGATLQVPFLADLTTMVDPTSRWSYLSYLREHDRLFPFYFSERFRITRRDYVRYCAWVARSLRSCRFGLNVDTVRWDERENAFEIGMSTEDGTSGARVLASHVVLGVGTRPFVPHDLRPCLGDAVLHASDYLDHRGALLGERDVTVIGSGQSGAEVFLDLLRSAPTGTRLRWITRTPAFQPMEYSKLGLEHFTPDHTRYFHALPAGERDSLLATQGRLHKAISAETIADIHDLLHDRLAEGVPVDAVLLPGVEVLEAAHTGSGVVLRCRHARQGTETTVRTGKVVLATGYAAERPSFLEPLEKWLLPDPRGRTEVDEDYRVALDPVVTGGLYVQNAELHTHGVGAPDLGLGAHRAATILNAITGTQVYRLPARTAFTTFGLR